MKCRSLSNNAVTPGIPVQQFHESFGNSETKSRSPVQPAHRTVGLREWDKQGGYIRNARSRVIARDRQSICRWILVVAIIEKGHMTRDQYMSASVPVEFDCIFHIAANELPETYGIREDSVCLFILGDVCEFNRF